MGVVSGIAITLNALFRLVLGAMALMHPEEMVEGFFPANEIDFASAEGELVLLVTRTLGVCYLVFAFLFGHMIGAEKQKAGLRTALMLNVGITVGGGRGGAGVGGSSWAARRPGWRGTSSTPTPPP